MFYYGLLSGTWENTTKLEGCCAVPCDYTLALVLLEMLKMAAELSAARLRTGSRATDAASTSSKTNLASLGGESEPLYFYGEKFSR